MAKMMFDESMEIMVEDLSLGEMLNWNREIDGLTLKEFEAITGICYTLVSRYERDLKKISPNHEEIIVSYIAGAYDEQIKQLKQEKQQKKVAGFANRRTNKEDLTA
ncbi:helix-turn-helix transcriptional regulator [Bacillus sp. JJ634]